MRLVIQRVTHAECVVEGNVTGACAVFSAVEEVQGISIHSIFQPSDVPGYESFRPDNCPYCKAKQPISAIVNSFGYSALY